MNYIIITSIFPPTKSILGFSNLSSYDTIVVGDKKTPADWQHPNVKYLSVEDQELLGFGIQSQLPYNHYSRKMMGYLYAIRNGANVIVDTDDDNIPNENWSFPDFQNQFKTTSNDLGFINIYKNFTEKHIWPRGFPLNRILNEDSIVKESSLSMKKMNVGIWQGLADSDPDVDAIYRLTSNDECYFDSNDPIVLGKGTLCPFNSQNTATIKALFPLLYLPSFVTFRFTDILRGLIAQPIMWLYDYHLGFTKPTVIQERNPHNYLKDFESEIPCYLYPEIIIDTVSAKISSRYSIADNLYLAYESLLEKKIVTSTELHLIKSWNNDLSKSVSI